MHPPDSYSPLSLERMARIFFRCTSYFAVFKDMSRCDKVEETRAGLVGLNNKWCLEPELSISLGAATCRPGLPLEKVISLGDDAMYYTKSQHYRKRRNDV